MIEVSDIATKYQNMLNSNTLGYTFIIYSDFGDLKQNITTNEDDTKIAGVVSFLPSNLYGIGAKILNINTRLTLYINGIHKNKNGYVQQDQDIKQILNSIISAYNGLSETYTLNATAYNLTMSFGLPQNLEVINLGPLARCLPIELYITLSAVVNGVSSKDKKFYLNKQLLEVLNANTTRVRNSETNSKEDKNSTNTSELTNGINFRLTLPFLNEEPYTLIYDDLMVGRGNEAMLLEVNTKDRWDNYIVVFGENNDSLQDILNIGLVVNFVEGDDDVIEFGDDWTQEYFETIDVNGTEFDVTSVRATNTSNASIVIFWGDSSSNRMAIGETITHTYTDDIIGHNVIVYGTATLLPIFEIYDLSAEQDESIMGYLYESNVININYPDSPSLLLEVIGEGEIIDYYSSENRPYNSYSNYITELILDNDISKIGNNAFYGFQLKQITIPENCITIGNDAFNCLRRSDFEGIDFNNNEVLISIGNSAFEFGGSTPYILTEGFNLVLPNSVETLGNSAFLGTIYQETIGNSITLGENITNIGNQCFVYNNVVEIIINATTPPTKDYDIFGDLPVESQLIPYTEMVNGNCVIRVPDESVSAYKSAWTEYADYIYSIE